MTILIGALSMGATCGPKISEKMMKDSDLHLEMANSHLDEGRLVDARREAVLAIQSNPSNAEAHFMLAWVFAQMGEMGMAEDEAKLALKYSKHYPEASNLLGVIYIEQGRYDDAVGILIKVTEDFLYSTPHLAYGNLGLAYIKLEKYPEALEALERAVELQPMFCLGFFRIGLVYYEQKRYKDALESFEKAVKLEDPWKQCGRLQDAWMYMGLIYLDLDSPDESADALRTCIEIEPDSASGLECRKKLEPFDEPESSESKTGDES